MEFSLDNNTTYIFSSENSTELFSTTEIAKDSVTNVSQQCSYKETVFYYKFVALYILIVFGIVGNVFSFIVLQLKFKASTSNFYLKALAVADTLLLFSALCHVLEEYIVTKGTLSYVIYNITLRFVLSDISQFVSVWLIVILACTRYIAVAKPLNTYEYFSYKKAVISTTMLVIVAVIFEAIRMPIVLNCQFDKNTTSYKCGHNYKIKTNCYIEFVYFGLGMFVIPLVPLLIFSFGLIKSLHRNRCKKFPQISTLQKESKSITKMVIVIILIFVISYSTFFMYWLTYIDETLNLYIETHKCFTAIFDSCVLFGYFFNSSVNFIVYLFCKKSFRSKCIALFSKKSKLKGNVWTASFRTTQRSNLLTSKLPADDQLFA